MKTELRGGLTQKLLKKYSTIESWEDKQMHSSNSLKEKCKCEQRDSL